MQAFLFSIASCELCPFHQTLAVIRLHYLSGHTQVGAGACQHEENVAARLMSLVSRHESHRNTFSFHAADWPVSQHLWLLPTSTCTSFLTELVKHLSSESAGSLPHKQDYPITTTASGNDISAASFGP